jgi:hypothetical protein
MLKNIIQLLARNHKIQSVSACIGAVNAGAVLPPRNTAN